jgi:hypothetical protein
MIEGVNRKYKERETTEEKALVYENTVLINLTYT